MALPLGTSQRRLTVTTLRTCTASVKHSLPLANLFAFTKQGHKLCSFIPQKQLALYANPLFWQYGLFAFVSRCCSHNNQRRRQIASAAKAALTKQEKSSEKDVDALTFMQTVVMSFVRGMEYGDQTLPINDLFVYFPVQLVPALVTAMEQQRFASVSEGRLRLPTP